MEEWLISVIVPVYNVEKYLSKCIGSICNQTYNNLQIILVDDGSSDGSGEICNEYAKRDNRIEVLHTSNGGLVAARKHGLRCAKGNYIGFVDGDDYIDRDMYAEMLNKLTESKADFIHTGYKINNNNKEEEKITFAEETFELAGNKYDFIRNKTDIFMNGDEGCITNSIWSKLFKRELICKAYSQVPDTQQLGEDGISLCRCIFEASRFVTYPRAFYHYVIRDESMSHIDEPSNLMKYVGLYSAYENIFREYGCIMVASKDLELFLKKLNLMYFQRISSKGLYVERYKLAAVKEYKDKSVILYGAGTVGKNYYTQLARYQSCEIVAWVDKDYQQQQMNIDYFELLPPEDIVKLKFDYIIIASLDRYVAEQIKNQLAELGIDIKKIVWEIPQKMF